MRNLKFCILSVRALFLIISNVYAQVPVKVVTGQVIINDGDFVPNEKKYASISDTLSLRLKHNPSDTTSLFFKALLLDVFNDVRSKPAPNAHGALENLVIARGLAEKAIALKMMDFKLKVLCAQIYKDLCYRYSGDETWKFNTSQIAERRIQFNDYKTLANKYYDEISLLDNGNAYDYHKLKVTYDYPIR